MSDVEDYNNYVFERGDIVDKEFIQSLFKKYNFDGVIHLAAESHVDRSISNPMEFVMTNVVGTLNLLNVAKKTGVTLRENYFIMCQLMKFMGV